MKRFRDIIEDIKAPSTSDLWLCNGDLKYFGENGWQSIGSNKSLSVAWEDINNKPEFATVATSGSYNDLSDKPTIPPTYSLPTANADTLGGVKSATTGTTSGRDYNVQVNSDGTMKVNVPWVSYSLPNASTSVRGGILMATSVADLAGTEDTTAICTKINALLAALRTSGVLQP